MDYTFKYYSGYAGNAQCPYHRPASLFADFIFILGGYIIPQACLGKVNAGRTHYIGKIIQILRNRTVFVKMLGNPAIGFGFHD